MKVIIAGASGMVGNIILQACIEDNEINEIVSLVRKPTSEKSSKLKEVEIENFANYSIHSNHFENIEAAFFCIGAYTGKVSDEQFKEITVDYAVEFAQALANQNPKAKLCFLSGSGADRTEKSRMAFARYKGMAENQIAALGLEFYTFRPGYIYPVTPREEPNFMYKLSRTLYPLIRLFGSNTSIKSTELAKAMFNVALNGTEQEILENRDITSLV